MRCSYELSCLGVWGGGVDVFENKSLCVFERERGRRERGVGGCLRSREGERKRELACVCACVHEWVDVFLFTHVFMCVLYWVYGLSQVTSCSY